MTPEEFLEILVTKDWASSGGSTVENDSYNKDYPKGVWQRDVIKKKSIVVHVGLREIDGRQVMVNEIVWNVQSKSSDVGSETFYDIQKWYCCGYP